MPLTRIDAETILIRRCGAKMVAAGMDGVTIVGTNVDVIDPLVSALLAMGYSPASIAAVTNTDLAAVDDINQILDRAELRLLQNIAGNLVMVDITVGPRRESLSQLSEWVEKQITRIEARNAKAYGDSLGTLSGGSISLDFQEPSL